MDDVKIFVKYFFQRYGNFFVIFNSKLLLSHYKLFSVDISDGVPPLKLPYNRGDDPWMTAQKFIHKNELPQAYLDQVANFIITNSGNYPIMQTAASGFEDPFTGGGRYIPGSSSGFNSSTGNVDPFTGASSYSTQNPSIPVNFVPRSKSNVDGSTSTTKTGSSSFHFPYKQYTTIVTCDPSKILSKLR